MNQQRNDSIRKQIYKTQTALYTLNLELGELKELLSNDGWGGHETFEVHLSVQQYANELEQILKLYCE